MEDQSEKNKLADQYRENLKQKTCKYMKDGNVDDCPFGNKCFYKVGKKLRTSLTKIFSISFPMVEWWREIHQELCASAADTW